MISMTDQVDPFIVGLRDVGPIGSLTLRYPISLLDISRAMLDGETSMGP